MPPRPEAPVCLLHLAGVPHGLGSIEAFLAARGAVPAGVAHELVVLLNGWAEGPAAQARALVEAAGGSVDPLPATLIDLEAYRRAFAGHPAAAWCVTNSSARPLAAGWLAALVAAAAQDGTLAAATGSFETQRVPFPADVTGLGRRAAAGRQLLHAGPAVRTRLAFPAAPNPHLRTNALALTARTLAGLDWRPVTDKPTALRLESGRRSLSRQAERLVLVDADGRTLPPPAWPDAHVFRSGEQERLLVADNRTEQWAQADPAERATLRRLAWG